MMLFVLLQPEMMQTYLYKTIHMEKHETKAQRSNLKPASFLPSLPIAKLWFTGSVPETYVTRREYFGAVGLVAPCSRQRLPTSWPLPLCRDSD